MKKCHFLQVQTLRLGTKLLEVVYIVMGLITIYTGVKNARDKENPSRVGTAVFWCALGIVLAFGRWIPAMIDGILVIVMTLLPFLESPKSENQKHLPRSL